MQKVNFFIDKKILKIMQGGSMEKVQHFWKF